MNKRAWLQVFLSIGLLAFEIVLFNQSKYSILERMGIPPYPGNLAIAKWWTAASFLALLLILALLLNKKRKSKETLAPAFFVYLLKGMQSRVNSLPAILSTLYILIHIGWIGSFLMDGAEEDIPKAIISFCFLLLNPILYLLIRKDLIEKHEEYKGISCLISQLPTLKVNTNQSQVADQYYAAKNKGQNMDSDDIKIDPSTGKPGPVFDNIDPARKMIRKMKEVTEAWFITTNHHHKQEKHLATLSDILHEYFKESEGRQVDIHFYPELKDNQEYVRDLDPNDLDKVEADLNLLLNRLHNSKIPDTQIAFNITSGTSVMSSMFTLKAIKYGRRAFHIHQSDNNRIIPLNVSIYSIKEHWEELIEKL